MPHNTFRLKRKEVSIDDLMIGDWVFVYNESNGTLQMKKMEPEFYSQNLKFVGIPVCEKFFKLNFDSEPYADDSGDCYYVNHEMVPGISIHMHYEFSADIHIINDLNPISYELETKIEKRIFFVHELQQALKCAGVKDFSNNIKISESIFCIEDGNLIYHREIKFW